MAPTRVAASGGPAPRAGAKSGRYGLYCIAPKVLREEGILLENMVAYANKGQTGLVPPSFYFIFTLKADMITSCASDKAQWKLLKMGPGAPEGNCGSRQARRAAARAPSNSPTPGSVCRCLMCRA